MKKKIHKICLIGFGMMIMLVWHNQSFAQTTYPKIYQNWDNVFESPTHYEVSVKIVQCDSNGSTQLFLELLNEGSSAQTTAFKLYVEETVTGDTMVEEVKFSLGLGQLVMPSCGNSTFSSLKFDLPTKWDATKLNYTVTLIP